MSDIKQQLLKTIDAVFERANQRYGTKFTRHIGENEHVVQIKFTTKGLCAGKASRASYFDYNLGRRVSKYGLQLSLEAAQIDLNDALTDTIPHEIAHLVCFAMPNLGRNHDSGWRRVCINLGGTGKRCHSMRLTPARKVTRHLYKTTTGKVVEIGPKRHANMMKRGTVYRVRGSGSIDKRGYLGVADQPEPQVQQAARNTARKPGERRTSSEPSGVGTKSQQVQRFMAANPGCSKQVAVQWMIDNLAMTKAGASTYYYKFRN